MVYCAPGSTRYNTKWWNNDTRDKVGLKTGLGGLWLHFHTQKQTCSGSYLIQFYQYFNLLKLRESIEPRSRLKKLWTLGLRFRQHTVWKMCWIQEFTICVMYLNLSGITLTDCCCQVCLEGSNTGCEALHFQSFLIPLTQTHVDQTCVTKTPTTEMWILNSSTYFFFLTISTMHFFTRVHVS